MNGPIPLPVTLGQARPNLGEATWSLVWLLVVVLASFVVAGLVIYIIRSRTLRSDAEGTEASLTLAEVRRMHRDGEIDDAEMERLKGIVTAKARKGLVDGSGKEGD